MKGIRVDIVSILGYRVRLFFNSEGSIFFGTSSLFLVSFAIVSSGFRRGCSVYIKVVRYFFFVGIFINDSVWGCVSFKLDLVLDRV